MPVTYHDGTFLFQILAKSPNGALAGAQNQSLYKELSAGNYCNGALGPGSARFERTRPWLRDSELPLGTSPDIAFRNKGESLSAATVRSVSTSASLDECEKLLMRPHGIRLTSTHRKLHKEKPLQSLLKFLAENS